MTEISEKQLEANRENAKLSTGPRSEEGKATAKLNSIKHGLLSKEVVIEGENEDELIELGKKLRSELKPDGELELLLVDRIAANYWRLKRALRVEKNAMEYGKNDDVLDFTMSNFAKGQKERKHIVNIISNEEVEKVVRYEASIERSLYKALHEFQRIQATRLGDKVAPPIAIDVNLSKEE